jgi:hypothetical protein
MRDITIWFASCVLAGTFLWAALSKLGNRAMAAEGVAALTNGRIFGRVAVVVSGAVIGAELLVAGLLLLPVSRTFGAAGALTLLLLFSALIVSALVNGNAPVCFCFGTHSAQPVSTDNLVRNAALGAMALVAFLG